jgi:hypothetical protein
MTDGTGPQPPDKELSVTAKDVPGEDGIRERLLKAWREQKTHNLDESEALRLISYELDKKPASLSEQVDMYCLRVKLVNPEMAAALREEIMDLPLDDGTEETLHAAGDIMAKYGTGFTLELPGVMRIQYKYNDCRPTIVNPPDTPKGYWVTVNLKPGL